MTTLATMRDRINDELLLKGEYTTHINRAIQSAIAIHEKTRFRFNHGRSTTLAPANFEYIEPPPDMIEEDELVIIDGTERRPLIKRSYLWIGDQSRNTDYRSRPLYYAVETDDLRLYPIPDQEYTLQISYLKKLSTLSADTDSNEWMVSGEELIRLRAKRILLEDVLRGPESYAEADRLSAREAESLRVLRDEWKRLAAHDNIDPFCFPGGE